MKGDLDGVWWYMPIIMATREAERDRMTEVMGQPGQKLVGGYFKTSGAWWFVPAIPDTGEEEVERQL
jgi:hypothetical protein